MIEVEYTTPSGLVVRDRRDRAFPCDVEPNDNDPVGSVGPNVDAGYGDTHVMYPACGPEPPMVQAWQGWPVEWATPNWGATVGLDALAARVSTVFAGIDRQAWILSSMAPYRTRGDEVAAPVSWMRNPQPEVYAGWSEAMRQIVYSYLGCGEVFLWATSRWPESGRVRTWLLVDPNAVTVTLDGAIARYSANGTDLPSEDILHIKYASWPGDPRGHGPLEAAARALYGAEALERYAAQLAARGGIPWGVLQSPRRLTANQANDMQRQYVNSRASAAGAPAVLSGGITLETTAISPKDMALLELRQFDEARIAVLLGVPPYLLGLPSGADSLTYQTVEGIYDYHWRSSLRPLAGGLMEAISGWALPPGERLELNRDDYVRPPMAEHVAALATLFNLVDETTGERVISRDEIRADLRLDSAKDAPASATSLAVPA